MSLLFYYIYVTINFESWRISISTIIISSIIISIIIYNF